MCSNKVMLSYGGSTESMLDGETHRPGKGFKLDPMSMVLTLMPMCGLLLSGVLLGFFGLERERNHHWNSWGSSADLTIIWCLTNGIWLDEGVGKQPVSLTGLSWDEIDRGFSDHGHQVLGVLSAILGLNRLNPLIIWYPTSFRCFRVFTQPTNSMFFLI